MLKSLLKFSATSLLMLAIGAMPLQVAAQVTNKPAAEKKSSEKKDAAKTEKKAHPFHGKLAAVDKTAKTIKIGETTYHITSETKITKAGKPATLEDGVVGEEAAGYAKPLENGKMAASSLRFGPKAEGKSAEKKKEAADKAVK